MFFDSISEVARLASLNGTSVFVLPEPEKAEIPRAIVLQPEDKTLITIEQVRNILSLLSVKQVSEMFILVRPADLLNDEAANALLKALEEPGEKVHFVLVTSSPTKLLPTILSRAAVYYYRDKDYDELASVDEAVKAMAKKLMVAKPKDLTIIADELTKKKDNVRSNVLLVLKTAIVMLYKSYFVTGKTVFLKKIPKFLTTYENISKNGHIKLHLVADLL